MANLGYAIAPVSVPRDTWPMYQFSPSHEAVFEKPTFRKGWRTELRGRINGGLAVVGNNVYVDSFDQHLYALDLANGSIRWATPLGNILMSTPVVAQRRVIMGSGGNGTEDLNP